MLKVMLQISCYSMPKWSMMTSINMTDIPEITKEHGRFLVKNSYRNVVLENGCVIPANLVCKQGFKDPMVEACCID